MILGLIMVIGLVVLASAQVDIPEDHIGTAVDTLFTGVLDAAYAVHGVLSLTPTDSITGSDLELDGAQGITIFKSGGHTYAAVTADLDDGVQILNVTDPSNIIATDSITEGGSLELNGARDITIFKSGGHTYAAVAAHADNGVQILNVTDPSNIIATDSITDGGSLELNSASDITTFKSGGHTYAAVTAYADDGVQILNVTDPSNIIATDSITGSDLELNGAISITIFKSGGNTYAAVAAFLDNGVQILNVTDPSNIIAADSITDGGSLELDGVYGITTFKSGSNTYAAVAARNDDGVQILNVTDPSNIIATDSITDTPSLELNGASSITTFVSGGHTYAAVTANTDDGVQILDVTNPSNIIATDSITDTPSLELDGAISITTFESGGNTYAAVTAYIDDGVQIIRIDITSSDTMPPILSLTGNTSVTISVGTTYNDEGAICEDAVDGTIIPTVVSNTVDTTQTGTYAVTYSCTDAANNSATQVSRTVIVQTAVTPDTTPPTFVSSELDTATRVLTITFSEIIDATNVDAAKIHIRESGTYTGGITLTANELVTTTNASTISFTLTIPHLETVKGLTTPELTVEPGAVRDTSGNLIVGTFDVSTATFTNVVFSVSGQEPAPQGMAFSNNGTKMFVVGWFGEDINEYTLSTPFDVSTASYAGDVERFSVSEQDPAPRGMAFSNDGAKMFVVGDHENAIIEYTLSTPFDVSTATFDDVVFSVSMQETTPTDMAFSNNGLKMFVVGWDADNINEYTLSTPFDVSTATFDDVVFSVSMQEIDPRGMAFSNDGAKMFVIGTVGDDINEYTLSTPFDVSTASYAGDVERFSVSGQDRTPTGMAFSNNGAKMFVVGNAGNDINEYTLSSVYPITVTSPPAGAFVTTWRTTTADELITLPISGSDMTVDWGDGNTATGVSGTRTHTYTNSGDHTVIISGNLTGISINDHIDASKLHSIDQWGNTTWTTMKSAFYGADNMVYMATDTPDLSEVTDMREMFNEASNFNGDLSTWNVSKVTDMSYMFADATSFNGTLSGWDVSSVTVIYNMFEGATSFNQDISGWNVSGVTDMDDMFKGATSFNGTLSGWDVSGVTDMDEMFKGATSFNGTLSGWDVSSVTVIYSMFEGATSFNQDISGWNVSGVTDMNSMFKGATSFNQDISGWDVSSANNMESMFTGASDFNQNLGNWFIVLDSNTFAADVDVLYISTQNDYLDQAKPAYTIDDTQFVIGQDSDITLNSSVTVPDGSYQVTITVDMPDFGSATHSLNTEIHVQVNPPLTAFVTTWRTTTADESITLPISGSDMAVDWGDGNTATASGSVSHIYNTAGDYTVQITGGLERFHLNNADDASKLVSIDQWGNTTWTTMENAFYGADNMAYNAADSPDLSTVTDMSGMFRGASSFNGNLSSWDVSAVTDMSSMFDGATSFDQPLNAWDVSSVTNMNAMFRSASSFNHPLNDWDVSSVNSMNSMFQTTSFDQHLNSWNVSSVNSMNDMFNDASSFNQPLNSWDVSSVTTMFRMFNNAVSFNQPLNSWDVSSVYNMAGMFNNADSFNQTLNSWDVSSVTDMFRMFNDADSFNQPLNSWNVSSVITMFRMFNSADSFNQPLNSWDVSSVDNMAGMFNFATAFSQNLGEWYVTLDPDTIAGTGIPGVVGTISAQNQPLKNHSPTYVIVDGLDKNHFEIAPGNQLNMTSGVSGKAEYSVNVTASGGSVFESGNNWRLLEIKVTDQITDTTLPADAFVTTWKTASADQSITINFVGDDMNISWGDGATETNLSGSQTHTYTEAGNYTVSVTGGLTGLTLDRPDSFGRPVPELASIDQWGGISWTNMSNAFAGASNMTYMATDTPDLSLVTDMSDMFRSATSFNGDLSSWDVSSVTDMSNMFHYATSFNSARLNAWTCLLCHFNDDVTKVMFSGATSFNQPLNDWDVSSVTDMDGMFSHRLLLQRQPLLDWDVSKVTDMSDMFITPPPSTKPSPPGTSPPSPTCPACSHRHLLQPAPQLMGRLVREQHGWHVRRRVLL